MSFHILGLLSFQTNKMAKKNSFRVVMRKTTSLGSVKYYPSFIDLGKMVGISIVSGRCYAGPWGRMASSHLSISALKDSDHSSRAFHLIIKSGKCYDRGVYREGR